MIYIKININHSLEYIRLEADAINIQYGKLNIYREKKYVETFDIKEISFLYISDKNPYNIE